MIGRRLVRGVSTRSKKVTVQLLRDFEGTGIKGEVLDVAEGFMRNRLETGNGACYVVNGVTKIPRVFPSKPSKPTQTEADTTVESPDASKPEKKSILDLLKFSSTKSSEAAENKGEDISSTHKTTESPDPNLVADVEKPQFDWENRLVKRLRE